VIQPVMFGFLVYSVIPDILTLAKGIGGGMPIGAFIASYNLMQALTHDPVLGHITTFGGHPVCCAAALACIEVIENEKLLSLVNQKEQRIKETLKHPKILNISGIGLLWAIEFADFEQTKRIIDRCIENGVITDWFLFASNKLRIAPPLNISMDELDFALQMILKSIDEVA